MGVWNLNFVIEDQQVQKLMLSSQDIIGNLSPETIKDIVYSLGADRHEETPKAYIFPTICHNENVEEASMKLYYYFDNRIFMCYTECNKSFNIIQLVQKVRELHGESCTYEDAKQYVLRYLNVEDVDVTYDSSYKSVLNKYQQYIKLQELPEYDKTILSTFVPMIHESWVKNGIPWRVAREFNVLFSIERNCIVIPHYDINNRLVGIRVRNLNHEIDNNIPKYCPLIISSTSQYSHMLSMNLYGCNVTKDAIKRQKRVILFEGEKSVMLHKAYYGNDSFAAAVCGSNISKPQIDILVKLCGVNEICVAFDKEYVDYESQKAHDYFMKLYSLCQRYTQYVHMSFIYDYDNLLDEKDSPVDKGKEVFEKLYKNRVDVRC